MESRLKILTLRLSPSNCHPTVRSFHFEWLPDFREVALGKQCRVKMWGLPVTLASNPFFTRFEKTAKKSNALLSALKLKTIRGENSIDAEQSSRKRLKHWTPVLSYRSTALSRVEVLFLITPLDPKSQIGSLRTTYPGHTQFWSICKSAKSLQMHLHSRSRILLLYIQHSTWR